MSKPLWIMIAGPYASEAKTAEERQANLCTMNEAAYAVFKKGHIPVIGVNMALPIIEAVGQEKFDELMMPISLALAERCDAILRIGGASIGADQEVKSFRKRGLQVFMSVEEVFGV